MDQGQARHRGGAFWSDARWRNLPAGNDPVQPFRPNQIEDANYLLSIGDEIYVSSPESKNTIQKLTDKKENFSIDPGQFAFVLTEEAVALPFDVIGFISIRAHIKFMGLVNISGFHVDPGYSGKLIFAVLNGGPTRIHLKKGDKIFPLWLADLDQAISRSSVKSGYQNIPSRLVNQISGQFTTAYQVKEQLDSIKEDVTKLKSFRLYVLVFLGLIGLAFFPTIRDNIVALFSSHRSAVQSPPATLPPV